MLLAIASPALGEEKGRVALKRKSLLGAKVRLYLARDGALEEVIARRLRRVATTCRLARR